MASHTLRATTKAFLFPPNAQHAYSVPIPTPKFPILLILQGNISLKFRHRWKRIDPVDGKAFYVSRKQPKYVLIKILQADFNRAVVGYSRPIIMFVLESKNHNKKINCRMEVNLHALTLMLDAKSGQIQATVALSPSKELRIFPGLFVRLKTVIQSTRRHIPQECSLICNQFVPNIIWNLVLIKENFHLLTSMPIECIQFLRLCDCAS